MSRTHILRTLAIPLICAAGWNAAFAQIGPPPAPAAPQEQPGYSLSVDVPVVNLDVVVTDDDGNYLTQLKKENFRVTEDGVAQKITNFNTGEAPVTVVLLLEFSQLGGGWFLENATRWADRFLRELKPTDWVALSTFSARPKVEVDFTHSQPEIRQALASMVMPNFHESNLFDALSDTIDRLDHVKGKKSILLLASGINTFSEANLDDVLKRLRESDVTIYSIGVGEQLFLASENTGGISSLGRINYLQAQNQLRSFAELTGGRAWFPRFDGEIPGLMADIAARLRYIYGIAYTPANQNFDGRYRKIRVDLIAADGKPLTVIDPKGKKKQFAVYVRDGYVANKRSIPAR